MCLYISRTHSKAIKTRKDRTVYKALGLGVSLNMSPVFGFEYKPNTLVQSDLGKPTIDDNDQHLFVIHQGLHAYRNLSFARSATFCDEKIVAMTIPKGSMVYIGIDGDIVSNALQTGSLEAIS